MSHISSISGDDFMFLWGLPSRDFIYALAWEPASLHVSLRRRSDLPQYWNGAAYLFGTQQPMPTASSIEFPSWCWAGWVGPVKYDMFKYPLLSCWSGFEDCFFSSTLTASCLSNAEDTTGKEESLLTLWSLGILSLSADVATLEHDILEKYEKHCADDDSCEDCRGETQIRSRTLRMDNGSTWQSGTKEGILLLEAVGFVDDFCSHTILLTRRDAESGICYREGIIEMQRREWEAAKPSRQDVRLG